MDNREKILLNKGKLITANMLKDIYNTQNNKINCIDDIKEIKKQYQTLKEHIIEIYNVVSKRIAFICLDNKGFSSISTDIEHYINYKIIIKNYEKIFDETYNQQKAIIVDLKENTIQKLYPKANEIDDINSLENKQIVKKLSEKKCKNM